MRFVEEHLDRDDVGFLQTLNRSSKACGSEEFCREIENRYRERAAGLDRYIDVSMRRRETPVPAEEITEAVCSEYGISKAQLARRGNREAKDFWVRLLHRESALKQREIGMMVGHSDGATVGRRLSRLSSRLAEDAGAAARYQSLKADITNRKA